MPKQELIEAVEDGEIQAPTVAEKAVLECIKPIDYLFDLFDKELAELGDKIRISRETVANHRQRVHDRLHDIVLISNDLAEVVRNTKGRLIDIEHLVTKVSK